MNRLFSLNPMLAVLAIGMPIIIVFSVLKRQSRVVDCLRICGPAPLPLVGNLLSIDAKQPWKTYTTWAAHYGDIFVIRVLKQDIIVISSEKIARELLERRSRIYSDRPYLASLDPFGWSFNFSWAPYGDHWRVQRKMFHQAFRAEATPAYHPIQLRKACQLVLDIINTPCDYYDHVQRFSAGVILSIVYDYEVAPNHDPLIEILERGSMLAMEGLTPETSSIIDAFPFVLHLPAWFPGVAIARKAAASKRCAMQMITEPFQYAQKREAEGSDASAMALDLLRRHKNTEDPLQLESLRDTCATAYVAGTETTSSTVRWFIFAMLHHPEIQERAQAEIDAVVGSGRLPNFDDRPNLPYIEAILMETLRMYVIAPLGVPHSTTADDIYEDIFIPKGSTVVTNIWAMYHNENTFPEHDVFKPERFFKDGKLDAANRPSDSLVFGFGRRVCPGRFIAESSAWVAIVMLLCLFEIRKAVNDQGEEVYFEPDFTTGVTTHPFPFPCSITPRKLSDSNINKLLTAYI